MKKYSVIDIETTGGVRDGHKITEIAIINLDGDKVVEEYSTLINPERSIPFQITLLTGINNEMVADAPKFYEVAKKIVQMTQGRIFVAHNVFFDFNFIRHEFSELGYSFRREKLCTVRLARKHIPGHKSYSLGKICKDLGIGNEARHRAMGDAKATVELFQLIQNKIQDKDIIHEESSKLLLPSKLNREVYEALPNKCGVYYFYDEQGELLYVGKSKDIKKRVSTHFRADLKRKKDIALKNKIAHIDYKLMDHELAALLYECYEIKQSLPIYNTALKRLKFPFALELYENQEGILEFKTVEATSEHFHTYRSKKAATKRINAYYKSLIGVEKDSILFQQKNDLHLKTFGVEEYNKMLNKVFTKNIPKDDDFTLNLSKNVTLEVEAKRPARLVLKDETVEFPIDQDLFHIMSSYLA